MPVVISRAVLPFLLVASRLALLRPQKMAPLPVSDRASRHTEGPVRAPSALLVYISGYRAPPWHTASALSQLLPLRGPLGAPPEARRRSRFGSNSPTMCPHGDLNCDDKKQTGTRSSHAWREVCKRQACIRQKLGTARTGEEDGRSVRGEEGDK